MMQLRGMFAKPLYHLDKSSHVSQSAENPEAVVNHLVPQPLDQDRHREQQRTHLFHHSNQGSHRQLDQDRHREQPQNHHYHLSNQEDQRPHYPISPLSSVAMSLPKTSRLTDRPSLDLHRLLVEVLQSSALDVEEAH